MERDEELRQLVLNEVRLHSERTAAFLIANSFLIAAFAVLRQSKPDGIEIIPAVAGMIFALAHWANINYGETVLRVWAAYIRDSEFEKARLEALNAKWWLKERGLGRLTRNVGSWVYPVSSVFGSA
jgi:hypothetical protein